ncbi:TIGR00730 family Rossman fold protein [Pontivivens insulae]|uniref:Cytokinin riboside 5'-monophosphate phosphoribohydrolase n=1 Tax=Pontivivens insulae TaxID=1639689 RepID=A0A2R8AA80_9RHOB|nr:TIGR00730 family Rossman fold protein [Pontivivens insulae]RED13040.1 hypothetical protein DFR53_2175 [Pontivivens insulae]SPF29132.1 LOG family protein YvdD [Pontivivens insulae]
MTVIPTSICVFCGSRDGDNPAYIEDAKAIGAAIAAENWRVVFGAGDVGMMGAVADAAQAGGAPLFGVIPSHLVDREVGKQDSDTFIVTDNMHTRKTVMFANSDAILVLPGGPGTLDELFEVLTWRQLGVHDKPIVLLNSDGYWDGLVALIDHMVARGFCEPSFRDLLTVTTSADQAMEVLRAALS